MTLPEHPIITVRFHKLYIPDIFRIKKKSDFHLPGLECRVRMVSWVWLFAREGDMNYRSLFTLLSLFVLISTLVSCIDAKRFGNGYTPNLSEVHSPQFQHCEQAIDTAYAHMTAVKKRRVGTGSYKKWTKVNELLADALSAMINRQYAECVKRADKVDQYLREKVLH